MSKTRDVKVTRTYEGLFLIGYTTEDGNNITIEKPYSIIYTPEGIGMLPTDKEIHGKEIPEIKIPKERVLYSIVPDEKLSKTYIENSSGIIV